MELLTKYSGSRIGECRHPAAHRVFDPERDEVNCSRCGQVLQKPKPSFADQERYGRAPTNLSVFRGNMGTTSKRFSRQRSEPHHLHVLTEVYGSRKGTKQPINLVMKTCPTCKTQSALKIFGDRAACQECGAELGYYSLRWMPNGHGTTAASFWADLRLLEAWDGPDDDPILKVGREILSSKLLGRVRPEEAHFLARKCLVGLKELSRTTRRQVENLIDSILEAEKVSKR